MESVLLASGLDIVVVEDHQALRGMIVDLLSRRGHSVTGLSCAEEFSDELGSDPVDVLVADLNLPGQDGLSLVRRFRALNPQAGIVIISGRRIVSDKVESFREGADVYLEKPVSPGELIAVIDSLARRFA